MKPYRAALLLCLSLRPPAAECQAAAGQIAAIETSRDVSWKQIAPNVLEDQKAIWLFPAKIPRKKDLDSGGDRNRARQQGAIALDSVIARQFRNTSLYEGFNRRFTGTRRHSAR